MAPFKAKYTASEADKLKLVQSYMDGIQLVATAEALHLASKTGLNMPDIFATVKNSAGSSRMFETRGPSILGLQGAKRSGRTVKQAFEGLSASLQVARNPEVCFGGPIATAAEQVLLGACGAGYGDQDDSAVAKLYQLYGGKDLTTPQQSEGDVAGDLRKQSLPKPKKVAFVGLGSMGLGMATILVNAGFEVAGYDNYAPSLENFRKNGGKTASSVREAAQDADVLVMMPIYLSQGESILFDDGAIDALADDAVIVLCSTCPPSGIKELGQRISKHRSSLSFVDAPVSGGAVRAAKGDLIIMASADAPESIEKVFPVLDAFASTIGNTSNLKILKGLGLGSSAKLIIQYQAGTHAGAAAETIAFAARIDLDTKKAYDILVENGVGFIATNRLGRSVTGSDHVESKTEIITKDIGIVVAESRAVGLPVFLPSAAQCVFLQAMAAGWSKLDDSCVIRVWCDINGEDPVSRNA